MSFGLGEREGTQKQVNVLKEVFIKKQKVRQKQSTWLEDGCYKAMIKKKNEISLCLSLLSSHNVIIVFIRFYILARQQSPIILICICSCEVPRVPRHWRHGRSIYCGTCAHTRRRPVEDPRMVIFQVMSTFIIINIWWSLN